MAPSPYDLSCWWDVKHKHNNNKMWFCCKIENFAKSAQIWSQRILLVLTKKRVPSINVSDHKQRSYCEWKVAKLCLMLNVSWRERTVRASALRIRGTTDIFDYHPLLWQIRRRYSSGWYGSFVWETHVRYNNKYFVIFDLSRFSITFFLLLNQVDLSAYCSYHFSASNESRLRWNNTFIFLWRFQW